MCRQSTTKKERIVLKEFQRLLRSGRNYNSESMYRDAGAKCFLEGPTAGNIVRRHYRELIKTNTEMTTFISENKNLKFGILMKEFAKKFKVCERESRLIIGYMR